MSTLQRRIALLEGSSDAFNCACRHIEFRLPGGRVQDPTPPLCPHGRPWTLIRVYDLSQGSPTDDSPYTP